MARSIHETRRQLENEAQASNSDNSARAKQIQAQLTKKRRVKAQVQTERRVPLQPVSPTPVETFQVRVINTGQYLHYPASVEDILAVASLFPKGVLDGLGAIELCAGIGYQRHDAKRRSGTEPDPYTGRYGYETLPGVFTGRVLATYWPHRQRIRLYACVYDAAMPKRSAWELYLRLKMLATFVHEAAHHYDRAMRAARGRWLALAEGKTKAEMYAEKFEQEWVVSCVVPYLLTTYPEEWQELDAWITHHGGVSLPLSTLAGEIRTTQKRNKVKIRGGVFSVEDALEALARDVLNGMPLAETRLAFARELHYAEYYREALICIEEVLEQHPTDLKALTLQADIYIHQKDYALAEPILKQILAVDKTNVEAWEFLADVHEANQDWQGLLRVTDLLLETPKLGNAREWMTLLQRAQARTELGGFDGAAADLEELSMNTRAWVQRRVKRLRKELAARRQSAPVRAKRRPGAS